MNQTPDELWLSFEALAKTYPHDDGVRITAHLAKMACRRAPALSDPDSTRPAKGCPDDSERSRVTGFSTRAPIPGDQRLGISSRVWLPFGKGSNSVNSCAALLYGISLPNFASRYLNSGVVFDLHRCRSGHSFLAFPPRQVQKINRRQRTRTTP